MSVDGRAAWQTTRSQSVECLQTDGPPAVALNMNAPAARGHAIPATWVSLASQFDALESMNVSAHTRSRCPTDFDRARFDFFGKRSLFLSVVAILMVPYATILLPLYI